MALPIISVPTHTIIIPSNNLKIKVRGFTVEEQKLLLIALNSSDLNEMDSAVRQVINNCVISPEINVNDLTSYDVELIFIRLRAFSVGETFELRFKPVEETDCKACKNIRTVAINLLDVNVLKPEGHDKNVKIDDNITLIMKEPGLEHSKDLDVLVNSGDILKLFSVAARCIDKICLNNPQKIIDARDYSQEELDAFVSKIPINQFSNITKFFKTLPRIKHTVNIDCPECGRHDEYVIEGLDSFLA